VEIARIVLDYIKVVIWPFTALFCVFIFKDQIFKLISKITELNVEAKGLKLKLQLSKKILEKQPSLTHQLTENTEIKNKRLDPSIIWEIADKDFMFLDTLSKKELLEEYFPVSKEEEYRFNSLVNEGFFTKQKDLKFAPTHKGRDLLKHFKEL